MCVFLCLVCGCVGDRRREEIRKMKGKERYGKTIGKEKKERQVERREKERNKGKVKRNK